jgi:sugar phosphate permease
MYLMSEPAFRNLEGPDESPAAGTATRSAAFARGTSRDASTIGTSLRTRQIITACLLFAGYAAYYFCRADFSVAMPLLIEDLGRHGIAANVAIVRFGSIASLGVLAYALGKIFLAGIGDVWGGKRSFLVGLGGATAFTLLFASGGALPVFTIAWIGNRLIQSIGWAGVIKVCSKWFNYSSYGAIVGGISLSFVIGDAVARQWMGFLIRSGHGWKTLFYLAAAVAAVIFLANLLVLRESRTELGHPEARPNPLNVYAKSEDSRQNIWAFLKPLLLNRAFLIVCLISLGATIVRETFNIWTPVYLRDFLGHSAASAASLSAIFPFVGAISVVVTGWLSDRFGVNGRSMVMSVGLTVTAVALTLLMSLRSGANGSILPLVLIGAIAFGLLGPYSCLAGAIALDFGGKEAGASSSGIIDGVGYLGGVLAGDSVARLSVSYGWRGVFLTLAVASALSAFAAGYLFYCQQARHQVIGASSTGT